MTADRLLVLLPLLAVLLLLGCPPEEPELPDDDDDDSSEASPGDDDDSAGETPPEAISITCVAGAESAAYSWGFPVEVQLAATLLLEDGTTETAQDVSWTVVDAMGGSVDSSGVYTTPSHVSGQARIEARSGSLTDVCIIELHLVVVVELTEEDGILDALGSTAVASDDSCGPVIEYPLEGAILPRSLAAPNFQWTNPVSSNDVFVLNFSSAHTSMTVVTPSLEWTPNEGFWAALGSVTNSEEVTLTVAAGQWDPFLQVFAAGLCARSDDRHFEVGNYGLDGTVFYWSPITQGLWRIDVGATTPEAWWGPSESGQCVGCHSANLSNESLIAMVYEGGNGWGVILPAEEPTSPVVGTGTRRGNFLALNPTGTRAVRSFQGTLYLDDLENNVNLGTVPTSEWPTHPDWSPDGQSLVYSACGSADGGSDWVVFNCSVKRLDVLPDDQFGNEETLVQAGDGYSYYYPSFSPDSQWVAFNRATGSSYDNTSAQLMIVPAAGGTALELTLANGVGNLTNSYPRWAPSSDYTGWLAFASRRPYGHTTSGQAQLWATAVDFDAAALGLDPSSQPIWFPGQSPDTGNHTPVWVPRYNPEDSGD